MDLKTENDFNKYLSKLNYMVLYPDKKTKFFKSLREIMDEIYVEAQEDNLHLS